MKTNGELLSEVLGRTIRDGEIPYQANRRAIKAFDIFHDVKDGKLELMLMLEGLDVFLSDLEDLKNVAGNAAKRIRSALR